MEILSPDSGPSAPVEETVAGQEQKSLRPKDAATLIVLRRDPDGVRLLMGRRSLRHVFHPDKVVFPGGRVEGFDRLAPTIDELHPAVEAKLRVGGRRNSVRSIALAAIRETFEEVGVVIGEKGMVRFGRRIPESWAAFLDMGLLPSLSRLRFVARAITPPGRIRRYDARFLAVFADAIAAEVRVAEEELISPAWLSFDEARASPLPTITRRILDGLERRLADDPELNPETPVPFHYAKHGKRHESLI
jgi:8-oxo-dGTP pyrophosphatase MutT (NUDIX family)